MSGERDVESTQEASGMRRLADAFESTMGGEPQADAGEPRESAGRRDEELQRGELVGRFVVLSRIGIGGMGVVYAAYDPELDRKVALKLLLSYRRADERRVRVLREAQAMAKLADPNVVTIYDVGSLDQRVWIAMEFVQGQTLSRWRREQARSWREILAVFLRAGEGLVAAHAAGLVHRDFKPDNVMIGDNGRVQVMDFGLAHSERSIKMDVSNSLSDIRGLDALRVALTADGALVGTPQYMAPEQWEGAKSDARADQFSFCVALWEALYGAPPFQGRTVGDLMLTVLAGKIQRPTGRSQIPGWLHRALLRGLQIDPEARWPSMRALLDELGRGASRLHLGRILAAIGVVAAVLAGIVVGQRLEQAQRAAHAELRESVRSARAHSAEIVGNVLRLRAGVLADFDPLVLEVRRLAALQPELRAQAERAGGPRLAEVLTDLSRRAAELEQTTAEIEAFKAEFALLRNSWRVFPVLVAELTAAAPGLNARLVGLLRELLGYDGQPDEERGAAARRALAELVDVPAEARAQRELVRRHAELILESRPTVDRIVRGISALQADANYEPLVELLVTNDEATIGPDDAPRWALLLVSLGGSVWLLIWALRGHQRVAALRAPGAATRSSRG